jgi:hypothetical protein
MNDGILFTSAAATLILAENAFLSGFGSNTNYIDGPVKKILPGNETSFVFPLGRNGRFRPATITNIESAKQTFTAEFFDQGVSGTWDPNATSGMTVTNQEYWFVTPESNPAPLASIELSWGVESGVLPEENILMRLRVAAWDASQAAFIPAGPNDPNAIGTPESGTIVSDPFKMSGPFTFAAMETGGLPVELLEFAANPRQNDVLLNWTTVSEINNDYFEVERSLDATNFTTVGRVDGAGNSNHVRQYDLPDPDAYSLGAELIYYRLHQVDYNGAFSNSEVIPVQLAASTSFQLIHAGFNNGNQLSGTFTAGGSGEVEILCYDMNGRLVSRNRMVANKGVNNFDSTPSGDLAKGVYTVQLVFNGQAQVAKVPKSQ